MIRKFPACPAPMVRPANSSDPTPFPRGKGSGSKPASPGSSRGSESSSDQDRVAVPAVTGSKSEPSASGEVEPSKVSKETVEKKKSHPPKASGASSSSKPVPTPEGGVSSPNACGSKDIPPSDTAASGEADPVSVPDAPAPTERRNLKKEAESPEHLLTHRPYNPFCRGCVEGKIQKKPHRKGGLVDKEDKPPDGFGQQVTADHFFPTKEDISGSDYYVNTDEVGLEASAYAMIYDRGTGWLHIEPQPSKSAEDTTQALLNLSLIHI